MWYVWFSPKIETVNSIRQNSQISSVPHSTHTTLPVLCLFLMLMPCKYAVVTMYVFHHFIVHNLIFNLQCHYGNTSVSRSLRIHQPDILVSSSHNPIFQPDHGSSALYRCRLGIQPEGPQDRFKLLFTRRWMSTPMPRFRKQAFPVVNSKQSRCNLQFSTSPLCQ